MAQHTMADILVAINADLAKHYGTDGDLIVTGGGRGWTATTTRRGELVPAKGTSKIDAVGNLSLFLSTLANSEKVAGRLVCLCGCGVSVKGRFAPGHDARYHFAERARRAGYSTVEAYRAALKAERAARARN